MWKTLGIVEIDSVPSYSHRDVLHSLASRRLGHHSLLAWVVRRVSDCEYLSQVIVLADQRDARRSLISDLAPSNVSVCFGRQADALARFAAAARRYDAHAVVRVKMDHPFVDPGLID